MASWGQGLYLWSPVPEPRNGPGKVHSTEFLNSKWHLLAAKHPRKGQWLSSHTSLKGRAPKVSYVALWPARHGFPPTPPSQNELGMGWRVLTVVICWFTAQLEAGREQPPHLSNKHCGNLGAINNVGGQAEHPTGSHRLRPPRLRDTDRNPLTTPHRRSYL